MSIIAGVSQYKISITNRPTAVFWAGETIEGFLSLKTSAPIKCRAIRLQLTGEGLCHWHTGSGDDRKDYHGRRSYVSHRLSVWGNFYSTETLDNAGKDAIFDADSGNGDMIIPLRGPATQLTLAVRVMDYDWGKKDDLLGDVAVQPASLLKSPGEPVSMALRGGGEITLSATIDRTGTGAEFLKLRCHQATGLKSGDWFSKNDVYVQCYEVSSTVDFKAKLPEPAKNVELPPGEHQYPFILVIPKKSMPSSFECDHGDFSHVRYSLYSNIDIAWRLDPSTRAVITVLASDAPPKALMAPAVRAPSPPTPIFGCDCCCFRCCPKGSALFTAAIERLIVAPGDLLRVALAARNDTEGTEAAVVVTLVRRTTLRSGGAGASGRHAIVGVRTWELGRELCPAGSSLAWSSEAPREFKVPNVPPTFAGKKGTTAWSDYDPVTWSYFIEIKLEMDGSYITDMAWTVPIMIGSVPPFLLESVFPGEYAPLPAITYSNAGEIVGGVVKADGPEKVFMPVDSPIFVVMATEVIPGDGSPGSYFDPKEDANNFNGPNPAFLPSVPVVHVSSVLSRPLPTIMLPASAVTVVDKVTPLNGEGVLQISPSAVTIER